MDVALNKHSRNFGVKTHGEEHGGQLNGGLTQDSGLLGNGEGMEVDNAVENIAVVLARDPIDQSAQMVAKVDRTSGLDARKDAGHAETLVPTALSGMVGLTVSEARQVRLTRGN
jgi:hypothetical protein